MKFGLYFERNWATDGPHADCFDGCFDFTHDIYNPLDTGWDFANALLGNYRQYRESNTRLEYQGEEQTVRVVCARHVESDQKTHHRCWHAVFVVHALVCR